MKIEIITLLPGVFDRVFDESVLGAARRQGLVEIGLHSLREYGDGRHKTVDDTAFGGGPGMILKPGPLVSCIRDLRRAGPPAAVIGLTPQGVPLTQTLVRELAGCPRLILVCGRYEGFDERIRSEFDLQVSIGDYVLTGGEIAAMALVDAVSRMIPGTVGRHESVEQDSFYTGILDHPQYTRPAAWEGRNVPATLMEGHHGRITGWRRGQALLTTAIRRPDVLTTQELSGSDRAALQAAIAAGGNDGVPISPTTTS
ncbi:MAG TPA: tRNA (guanosine(37)-N1)-methyltransferase TrmD [Candidatus Ozemobacteraceae bacterium]|mgnify:CR=1 FL=1|nr:tRNA (guanosine(37)-N1)-methyltransferase TrmD [Candidatus Ozemobacteraceae bacterium]